MSDTPESTIVQICRDYSDNPIFLLDIAIQVQNRFHQISPDSIDLIAGRLSMPRVNVADVVSFYSFLSQELNGEIFIGLGDDIIDEFNGGESIFRAFSRELGINIGETSKDGLFTLSKTPYIGVPDQAPSVMINNVILTELTPQGVPAIINELRAHRDPRRLVRVTGDGNNSHKLVSSMIRNNIHRAGPVVFSDLERGSALNKALAGGPEEVIKEIKAAKVRGRGGAGFPTGLKWELASRNGVDWNRYVVCNADEGEPGTFKDRVILTENPDLVFEGMTICAYAVRANEGILYLRYEYDYLREFLEDVLANRRYEGLLGERIRGLNGFNFDIRIRMGAGAYICGEETSLLNSAEGYRGDPKTRPPFPVQKGLLDKPSIVNNVETFCCAARVIDKGAEWFVSLGSQTSTGTKVLSVSGDCEKPGIYEVPFGIKLEEVLSMSGAKDSHAVVIGGASGSIVGKSEFNREISYDDLATAGAVIVFDQSRDLMRVVEKYSDFFMDESCGYCTPCRVGTVLIRNRLKQIREGRASETDLEYLDKLGKLMKTSSRCGLGQAAPNQVIETLKRFRNIYEDKLVTPQPGYQAGFDLFASLAQAESIAKRKSTYHPH